MLRPTRLPPAVADPLRRLARPRRRRKGRSRRGSRSRRRSGGRSRPGRRPRGRGAAGQRPRLGRGPGRTHRGWAARAGEGAPTPPREEGIGFGGEGRGGEWGVPVRGAGTTVSECLGRRRVRVSRVAPGDHSGGSPHDTSAPLPRRRARSLRRRPRPQRSSPWRGR